MPGQPAMGPTLLANEVLHLVLRTIASESSKVGARSGQGEGLNGVVWVEDTALHHRGHFHGPIEAEFRENGPGVPRVHAAEDGTLATTNTEVVLELSFFFFCCC